MADSTDGADLEALHDRYDVILDRFYDKDLSERSLAQTYLEIVVEEARCGVVFPPEMILQAKAIVTAEALDLVLAPSFNFTEEVRPIVAGEFAKRASPARIADRLWGSLPEWILLGEAVPAGEAPNDDLEDEKQFRRLQQEKELDIDPAPADVMLVLTSLLTLLRFLVSQFGQTARESIWQDAG